MLWLRAAKVVSGVGMASGTEVVSDAAVLSGAVTVRAVVV